eukprot:6207558-Pleurochrysis_carterae.AAC.3
MRQRGTSKRLHRRHLLAAAVAAASASPSGAPPCPLLDGHHVHHKRSVMPLACGRRLHPSHRRPRQAARGVELSPLGARSPLRAEEEIMR